MGRQQHEGGSFLGHSRRRVMLSWSLWFQTLAGFGFVLTHFADVPAGARPDLYTLVTVVAEAFALAFTIMAWRD
jgi:hypothetical protein